MDPTKTTQTPAAGAPDATPADTLSVPGVGASTSTTTPGALDFTGNNTSAGGGGLSMADSLASAQDNLTSAGMAANDASNATLDLSQLGSSDPQATMDRPDEPLVPAAPVPGSIGSVTSGPAMTADAPAAQPAATETPAAAAPYNPFAPADSMTTPQAQTPADTTAPAAPAAAAQPDMSQTSSTNVPTALQPKTSKFSMKGDKPSMLTWILGIAAGVFAVAMIIFMVLWIQGMGNEKVVYVPNTVRPEPVQTSVVCTMDREAGADDGMDGLTGIGSTVNLNFSDDDKLTNYDVLARYTFSEAAQAEASRSLFATMASLFTAVGAGSEESPLSASYNVADNVVTLDMKTNVESALENDDITLDLPVDEASGEYLLDAASIKDYLGNQGYVCE